MTHFTAGISNASTNYIWVKALQHAHNCLNLDQTDMQSPTLQYLLKVKVCSLHGQSKFPRSSRVIINAA